MVALLTAYVFQRILLAFEENQPIRKWSKKLPWKAKSRLPREIEKKKTYLETGVKNDFTFSLGATYRKTNSESLSYSVMKLN